MTGDTLMNICSSDVIANIENLYNRIFEATLKY